MKLLLGRILGLVCVLSILALKSPFSVHIDSFQREVININLNWNYTENNTDQITELSNELWKKVDLPHTWNQYDVIDQEPGYRRDASWYEKDLEITGNNLNRYILYFEGSNISTQVYVNGQKAGEHIGGYVGFEIEISDYIKLNSKNKISIRVDNSYNPDIIPSQKNDFFIYGGITRDLWLLKLPHSHIQKTKISTASVSNEMAETFVEIKFSGLDNKEKYSISYEILDPTNNQKIISDKIPVKTANAVTTINLKPIKNPKLWSPDSPFLYKAIFKLYEGNNLIDQTEEIVGYRWFEFKENGPFYLNGKRLLLRGTHRHEEHAGYGAAMPNSLHYQDMKMIKEMGANFIRLGHYPQDPEIYKACNELGLIVWDELPWCRGGMGEETWQKNTKRLLKEQIENNFNHPSIFFWSMGNEVYWMPDFDNGDDPIRLNNFLKELNDISHQLDPNRMTSIRKYYEGASIVDVFSPSIWSGWYAGVYTNYQKTIEKNQLLYPRFLHMEYGGSSHVGRHTESPITGTGSVNEDDWAEVSNQVNIENIAKNGDWTENYMVDLFDWYLNVSENKSDFAGNAQWAFKDFGTPLRPENAIPYMNQKGLVDRAGNPKDAYYVYKSYWAKEPFVYIESHTWDVRTGPKDKPRQVSVFSNCTSVELMLNGKSLNKIIKEPTKFPAGGLNWDVPFIEGENYLLALGEKDGLTFRDSMYVDYSFEKAGTPDHIELSEVQMANGHLMIVAIMKDKNNKRVLDYESRIYFSEEGNGKFVQNFGTPTQSQVIEMANGKACIEYIPGRGKLTIEVRNQDFKGSYLNIENNQLKLTN